MLWRVLSECFLGIPRKCPGECSRECPENWECPGECSRECLSSFFPKESTPGSTHQGTPNFPGTPGGTLRGTFRESPKSTPKALARALSGIPQKKAGSQVNIGRFVLGISRPFPSLFGCLGGGGSGASPSVSTNATSCNQQIKDHSDPQ